MTEAEWPKCDDPDRLLACARKKKVRVGPREQRLLACGWARLLWGAMDPLSRRAVEAAEGFADGVVDVQTLAAAHDRAMAFHRRTIDPLDWVTRFGGRDVERTVAMSAVTKFGWEAAEGASRPSRPQPGRALFAVRVCLDIGGLAGSPAPSLGAILRDVTGNPFCPAALDPAWRTTEAVALAKAIYAERAFDRLPILADALEDAGCDREELLRHCRGDGPHVRGCWAVDMVIDRG